MINNVIVCQNVVRRFIQRKKLKDQQGAAVKIQSNFRGYQARKKYCQAVKNTLICQRVIRGFIQRNKLTNQRQAAIKIRRQQKAAAVTIQSMWRMQKQRQNYLKTLNAVVIIQAFVRGYLARKHYLNLQRSAVNIQKNIRCFLSRTKYKQTLSSVKVLQRNWRLWCACRNSSLTIDSGVYTCSNSESTIQHPSEADLQCKRNAAVTIQRWYRRQAIARCNASREKSALVIQSYLRGYRVRKDNRSKAVCAARHRVMVANSSATKADSMRHRMPIVLSSLLKSKFLSTAAEALKSLGTCTDK